MERHQAQVVVRDRVVVAVACAAITGALSGCYPALIKQSPRIDGALTLDGAPVEGARVYVQTETNEPCNSSPVLVVSNRDGAFSLAPRRHLELQPIIPLGDRVIGWRVCFEYQGRYYLGLDVLGGYSAGKPVRLECDLNGGDRGSVCRQQTL